MKELLHVPARINQASFQRSEAEEEAILERINRLTLEPIRSMDEVFVFSGICSNDRLDSYMTKMHESSLRNYVRDLKSGVSLLPSHDISQSPFGRSYDGELIEGNQVNSDWYIVRDLVLNGENTNDTIRAIKGGIKRDLSIGFGGDDMRYECSSCGRDLYDARCEHFPGLEDERGERSYVWVKNAILREVSVVYKGATPGAFIQKAREYYDQGQLSSQYVERLEGAYQIRLDDGKRSFYMPKNESKREEKKTMNQQARNSLLDDIRTAVRENKIEKAVVYDILAEEGDPFRQPEDIALRNELGKDYCNPLAIRQLKKEAQQGRRYLADVIDQAVTARVKAQGDGFNADSYRQILSLSGDIDHIKEEIDSYERQAKMRFVEGRQTEPENVEKKEQPEEDVKEVIEDDDTDNIFEKGSAE